MTETPESWRSYLTDLFNEISSGQQAKIASVLRSHQWVSTGSSAFDRLSSKPFSEKLVNALESAKESVANKARGIVKFFFKHFAQPKDEPETEKEKQKSEAEDDKGMK